MGSEMCIRDSNWPVKEGLKKKRDEIIVHSSVTKIRHTLNRERWLVLLIVISRREFHPWVTGTTTTVVVKNNVLGYGEQCHLSTSSTLLSIRVWTIISRCRTLSFSKPACSTCHRSAAVITINSGTAGNCRQLDVLNPSPIPPPLSVSPPRPR